MKDLIYLTITFCLSIASGIIGYYIKGRIDQKRDKKLKILEIGLNISRACVKSYNPIGFLPPVITVKLENLSKADITVKGITLKNKNQIDIFPVKFNSLNNLKELKQYEIDSFSYECHQRRFIKDQQTDEIIRDYLKLVETPNYFFQILYWYFYNSEEISTKWNEFDKKLSELIIRVHTNIGDYERKIKKKELKFFKKAMLKEFEKTKITTPVTLGNIG